MYKWIKNRLACTQSYILYWHTIFMQKFMYAKRNIYMYTVPLAANLTLQVHVLWNTQTWDMKSSGTKHKYQAPYISVTRSCLCEPRYTGRKALASTAEWFKPLCEGMLNPDRVDAWRWWGWCVFPGDEYEGDCW